MVRRKFIIFLVLIFALALFAYVRREVLFQQAKGLIKQKLEQGLPCKLSIGEIRAGLFYGLILENLEISFPQVQLGPAVSIKIDQAFVDYNPWENFLTQAREAESPKFALRNFAFTLEGGRISFGKAPPTIKNLQGRLMFCQNGLVFEDIKASYKENSQNALKTYGELSDDRLSLTITLEHLNIKGFDVLTNFSLTLNERPNLQNKTEKVSGTLKTYGSVVNNRPFPELNSSFEIQDDRLRILTFSLGDNYNLRGIANLSAPFDADLSLNFYQAAPSELIAQFTFPEQPDFSGLFNGLIKITGELSQPKVEGYLEVKQGHIGDLSFVDADINIKGRYPKIAIVDSRICREEDSFIMEAELDFSDLEQQDSLSLRFKPDKGILWQGWDITRKREDQVHMSKSIADGVKVTFDTFMEHDSEDYEDNYTNELGLEYRIFGDKLLKLRLRKEEEILGLERRIKF